MQKPQSGDPAGSAQPRKYRLVRVFAAAAEMDLVARLAIVCVFFAWFLLDTLVVSVGSVKHGVRFFDVGAVISDPTRMFFPIYTTFGVRLFAALCITCLILPLAPHLWRNRVAWVAYLAPLALMVVCGLALYSRTSGEILATPADVNGLRGSMMNLANKLLQRGSDLVSRHVAVSVGGYVALMGSLVLGYAGIRRSMRQPH